jgi:hypothetical protein
VREKVYVYGYIYRAGFRERERVEAGFFLLLQKGVAMEKKRGVLRFRVRRFLLWGFS